MISFVSRPRRNRVTPFGDLVATSARGLFMGNRGDLHFRDGTIGKRQWSTKSWICCVTDFSGYRATFDVPGRYTPLFFTDEAVALAAGHRPCGLCRPTDYRRFKLAWLAAYEIAFGTFVKASQIDAVLHPERVGRRDTTVPIAELPDGVFVTLSGASELAALLWRGSVYPWRQGRYLPPQDAPRDALVKLVTPVNIVAIIRAGYAPIVASSPQQLLLQPVAPVLRD